MVVLCNLVTQKQNNCPRKILVTSCLLYSSPPLSNLQKIVHPTHSQLVENVGRLVEDEVSRDYFL